MICVLSTGLGCYGWTICETVADCKVRLLQSTEWLTSLGMDKTEILCCDNHPLKYYDFHKYHDIYLVGYNNAKIN